MSTSLTTFRRLALEFRKHDKELQTIYSQVVQNVGDRIYRAFKNFFEGRARFPKWKKQHNIITTLSPIHNMASISILLRVSIFQASATSESSSIGNCLAMSKD
ncbi:MAG: hypothetical protein QXG05_08170 [Nitrososphaerota archaeon]